MKKGKEKSADTVEVLLAYYNKKNTILIINFNYRFITTELHRLKFGFLKI